MTRPRYDSITELPGNRVTAEQIAMIAARYRWAAARVAGADVLELACGAGLGLALLAGAAGRVVAGDLDPRCLAPARSRHDAALLRCDARRAPFRDGSFDVVLLFEAVYYLPDPDAFVREAARLLRPGGRVLLTAPNPTWPAFAPSPQSYAYFGPDGFVTLFARHGFTTRCWGAFPQAGSTGRQRFLGAVRRTATRLGLVPRDGARTEAVRALLKRVLYGRLTPLPPRVRPEDAPADALPEALDGAGDTRHRVLYVEAVRPTASALQSSAPPL